MKILMLSFLHNMGQLMAKHKHKVTSAKHCSSKVKEVLSSRVVEFRLNRCLTRVDLLFGIRVQFLIG